MQRNNNNKLLNEQIEYYRARAGEYDEWFFRQGRYNRGPEINQRWFAEIAILRQALSVFKPEGDVLELACGTGIWTELLVKYASSITAVDAAPEVLVINQSRTKSSKVRYIQADLFEWQPDKEYDAVLFSFWLSHVPPEHFDAFWTSVDQALKPEGRVFFIDSQFESTSTAEDHLLKEKDSNSVTRKLNDGREFQIVKVFYEPQDLTRRLHKLGWNCTIEKTPHYFFYGFGTTEINPNPGRLFKFVNGRTHGPACVFVAGAVIYNSCSRQRNNAWSMSNRPIPCLRYRTSTTIFSRIPQGWALWDRLGMICKNRVPTTRLSFSATMSS
jgi:demethylmenaquinone methyltransferase/2-methoxy-6-polyprenyl-1,4-benzoquinol methylase